jgi:hypothetical protein
VLPALYAKFHKPAPQSAKEVEDREHLPMAAE